MELSPDQRHTLRLLDGELTREKRTWISGAYDPDSNLQYLISSTDRRVVVWWMIRTNRVLKFSRETQFLAVAIFDKFLRLVKVQPKYLKCIGLTCIYVASKFVEEDDVIPSTSELVRLVDCGYSVKEVCRMEICILNQLQWDVNLVTPINILHLLYSLFLSHCKGDKIFENQQHVRYLYGMTKLLKIGLLHHQLLVYPPSIIALAVLSLQLRVVWPYWKAASDELMSIMGIEENQLESCRRMVISLMSDILLSSVKSTRRPSRPSRLLLKRKSEDDEDLTEGIKKLYTYDDDTQGTNIDFGYPATTTNNDSAGSSNPMSSLTSPMTSSVNPTGIAIMMTCGSEVAWFDAMHCSMESGKAT